MSLRLPETTTKTSLGRRVLGYLGVHDGEGRSVAVMTAHAFFMGCATVFFETAASALFLARFEARMIPWVYLAAAAVNLLTGSVYARLQARVTFARLMQGTLGMLLVGVVLMRLGYAVSGASWVVFSGMVGYRMMSSLTDLEYWAVASRIYDLRQAKRLFGLIGTGEVLARTAGALVVPLLVRAAGVSNLMVLSAAALVGCVAMARLALGGATPSEARQPVAKAPSDARLGLRWIAASPYLGLVVGVAAVATLGKYFVDFAFLEQLGTRSKDDVELASYLGVFAGLTQALSLATRLLVSRPLLARFGVRVGVLVLPVLQLACTLALIGSGLLGREALVFWLVLGNQGLYKTLKHPIDNASFKVLYQPLPPPQRLAAQIAVEIVLAPAVVGVAGGVMLLFSAAMAYDPLRFGLVLLATFALWTWLARRAGRGYLQALLDLLAPSAGPLDALGPPPSSPEAIVPADLVDLDVEARGRALARLDAAGFVASGARGEVLRGLLRDEAREAAWVLGAWRDLGALAEAAPLREALAQALEQARERVLAALACSHDRRLVERARDNLAHEARERRAYAHELLDLALSTRERAELLPLLDDLSLDERLARLSRRFPQRPRSADERLRELLARSPRWLAPAPRSLALLTARRRGLLPPEPPPRLAPLPSA